MSDKKDYVIDTKGQKFNIDKQIGEGGQGAVYRCKNQPRLLIKIINDKDVNKTKKSLEYLNNLPIPNDAHFTIPITLLESKNEKKINGYVMNLVRSMTPIWKIIDNTDKENVKTLDFYKNTGGLLRRLEILHQMAYHINLIHSIPLVYCDLSLFNIFISEDTNFSEVWFIDSDNLKLSSEKRNSFIYTPMNGSPEVVNRKNEHSIYSDLYSFALVAYWLLSLNHPFEGKKVLGMEEEPNGWDDEDTDNTIDEDIYIKLDRGELPWGLSQEDDTNHSPKNTGIPYDLILTEFLYDLFERTFSEKGRTNPKSRPSIRLWIYAIIEAIGKINICDKCGWTYYIDEEIDGGTSCPNCNTEIDKLYSLNRYTGDVLQSTLYITKDRPLQEPFIVPSFDYKNEIGKIEITDIYIKIKFDSEIFSNYQIDREELIFKKSELPKTINLYSHSKKRTDIKLVVKEVK
jgi:eukaryotic-like serine/threonine-protein kinase